MYLRLILGIAVNLLVGFVPIKGKFFIEHAQLSRSALFRSGDLQSANVLYECAAEDRQRAWVQTSNIRCWEVESRFKASVYNTATFYETYKPKSISSWPIYFGPTQRVDLPTMMMIGLIPNHVDHPVFEELTTDLTYPLAKVDQIAPSLLPDGADAATMLAAYFAVNNIRVFTERPQMVTHAYPVYILVLQNVWLAHNKHKRKGCRIFGRRDSITNQASDAMDETTLEQVKGAIPILLPKMLDPCSVMPPSVNEIRPEEQRSPADTFCAVYCQFLGTATAVYPDTPFKCKMLKGGFCSDHRCICYQDIPVVSIVKNTQVNMACCNNALRHHLQSSDHTLDPTIN